MTSDLPLLQERTWWRRLSNRIQWRLARAPQRVAHEPIALALVGAGNVAQWQHLPWLRRHPDAFRLVAVCDIDAARAARVAADFGAHIVATSAEIANQGEVEAVLVCTPPECHAAIAGPALSARKHVLAEKPLAHTIDEADRLWKCARRAHSQVAMVNFTFRCRPEFRLAADIIHSGTLGEIYQMWGSISQGKWFTAAGRPSQERADAVAWKFSRGGVLLDLGPHVVDLARWWLGEIRTAQAWTKQLRAQDDDATVASCGMSLTMHCGATAQLLCSRLATGAKEQTWLEVNGAQGSLRFTPEGLALWTRDTPRWRQLMLPAWTTSPLDLFAHAVRRRLTEIPTFWDGFKANEAIAALEQSAETGARIELPLALAARRAAERDAAGPACANDAEFGAPALARKA